MQQSEICCVCIRTNLELIGITETDPNTIKYSSKLNQCVPEVVWNEDNRICEHCIEQLEAACAFRDLCLQSDTIRRQLESSIPTEDLKTEEITIEDSNIQMKDEEPSPNVEVCFVAPQGLPVNTNPNKSYLRDLLETPQELFKVKGYSIDKNYAPYLKETASELGDDDIVYVDTQQHGLDFLQKVQPEVILIEARNEDQEEMNEEEEVKINEDETKAYSLNEDGIELVEENGFARSLLRDLLLKPQDAKKDRIYPEASLTIESFIDNSVNHLPDPPRTEHNEIKHYEIKFKDRPSLTTYSKELLQFDHPWDCIYCNRRFKSQPELKLHEKSLSHQRKCYYNTKLILAKHKIIKQKPSNDRKYICPHCNQKYPFKTYRDQHIRCKHTNAGNEFICFHCNIGFSSKLLLIDHIRYKHNDENLMKQCHVCRNTYINQDELEAHMLQKHNLETMKFPQKIQKYKCDKCSKLYTTLNAKISHYEKCDGIRRHASNKITL